MDVYDFVFGRSDYLATEDLSSNRPRMNLANNFFTVENNGGESFNVESNSSFAAVGN